MSKSKPKSTVGGKTLKDILAALKSDEALMLDSGATYQGGYISGLRKPLHIIGNGAYVLNGLTFEKCGPVIIETCFLPDAPQYGLKGVNNDSFRAYQVTATHAGITNFETANQGNATFEECIARGAINQHGFYLSQSGDNLTLKNNVAEDNAFSGYQVNAVEDHPNPNAKNPNADSVSKNVIIVGNTSRGNQRIGKAGAIQLSGVHGGRVTGNKVLEHHGRNCLTLWDDGTGKPALATIDVLIDDNDFEFAADAKPEGVISIGRNCTYRIGINRFPAGVTQLVSA